MYLNLGRGAVLNTCVINFRPAYPVSGVNRRRFTLGFNERDENVFPFRSLAP